MKRLLLILLVIGLYIDSVAQDVDVSTTTPVMTGNITGRKELATRSYTFNVGSAIPYLYLGGSTTKLQVGFPYNVLYMDKTFPGGLFASKGYYPDYIQLKWEVVNNASKIDHFEIYRKKMGDEDSIWVDNLTTEARKWEDYFCEANEVYEYTLHAIGITGEKSEGMTHIYGIGLRAPLGTVTGRVSYSGGSGVKDVIITASTEDEVPARSISMSVFSYLEIPQYVEQDFSNGFTFQAYLKFRTTNDAGIFSKDSNFELWYTSNKFVFKVGNEEVQLPFIVPIDTFVHISAVYDGDSARIFIPTKVKNQEGYLIDTLLSASAKIVNSIAANENNINLGNAGSSVFRGEIDEVRIWKRALEEEEILRDYNRYIMGKEVDLFAYLRMNEGFGNWVYDISKMGSTFNENHARFKGANVSWSEDIPTIEQLGNRGITDQEGNYIIAGIPFLTDGSAYKFTPMLAPHEFEPSFKILFLNEDAIVHNNINFTDISSFKVNGSVAYRHTTKTVKGVKLMIDGEFIFDANAKAEETDEDGNFEIEVPIGYHYIGLSKAGHEFDNGGRWPYDEAYPDSIIRHNFNQNLTFGKPFSDTTLITVVGRVIGGTSSNEIAFGFGQSENNIGKATITLDHSSANPELTFDNVDDGLGDETISYSYVSEIDTLGDTTFVDIEHLTNRIDIETKIFTSEESGEFVARLIPEKFVIVEIDVDNDGANNIKNFFGNKVIDLSVNPTLKYEYLYDEEEQLLDSLPYHVKLNYIYQTTPEIDVTNTNDTVLFYGEEEIVFTDPVDGSIDTIIVADHFIYPIFQSFKDYSPKVSVFESYHNFDSGKDTRQSIKEAEVKITNNLALTDGVKIYQLKPEMDGVVVDTFKVGIPNISKSEGDQTSFTKTIEVNVTVEGNEYAWEPGGKLYRAYITGQRPKGNNFYTEGPQIPEIILHDPPGSRSYAYIKQGSSYTVSSGFSTSFDNGSGFGLQVLLGVTAAFGGGLAGPVIKTDSKNSGETGLSFSTTVNESGQYVQSYSFSEQISTSSDPGMVGAMADIYIGKSYNYFYGETDNLKILPYDLAETNGVTALEDPELDDTKYTLGIVEGYIMNPDNSDTYFKYTQAHILNKLLPELEDQRNNLFLTAKGSDGNLKYICNPEIDKSDLRYGIAHSYEVIDLAGDTIVNAYYKMSDEDSILSYSFRPEKQIVEDLNDTLNDEIYENDSIRYFNVQIGIWIDAIRSNESEKAMAIEGDVFDHNISFDGGVGAISRSEVQTISYSHQESRTKNMQFSAKGSVGFNFNGAGLITTGELSISHSLGVSSGESFSQTMEYGYTLSDGNVGDYYSINVYRRPDKGIYNADDLEETKVEMPSGFDFGILGQGVSLVGGAIAVAAASSYNAGGGIPIVAGAATMAIAAGLSYIPYVSFKDEVEDEGDRFSPGDIRVSSFDISSPIFQTLGGQTMCPHQGHEHTFFYRDTQGDSIVLQKATLQREKPEIIVEPSERNNVPINEKAFFDLKLINNSESGDDQIYGLMLLEGTNPDGAAVRVDGMSPKRTFLVEANQTLTKSLSLAPTDFSVLEYDSIGIAIYSICQSDPTDFMPDIIDCAYISASFQPACINVEIQEPLDNWVVNVRDNDTMTIRLGDYNLAFYSFQSFRVEYKPSSGSIWVPIKHFVNDPLLENKDEIPDTLLINDQPFVSFDWDMTNLKDREYDIRVVSTCSDGSENESEILSGMLDGQRPQLFGTPQPADGILNIDENISLTFNEPIEGGLLTEFNFNIKGTLNYDSLKHEAYLRLNGSTDYGLIPEGISFNNKSFTVEFWVRTDDYRNSVFLSQGNDPATSIEIGLRDNNKTYFKLGNVEYEALFKFPDAVPAEAWQHMAYVYDYENGDIFIYQNDKILLDVKGESIDIRNSGDIYLGKSSISGSDYFAGSFHELRIWSKYLSIGDVYANQYKTLSGNEVGLYGYWPVDEAFGNLAIDKAANRHMEVFAPWEVYPGGSSWNFAGNNSLEFLSGYFAIIPEMDYTIEFWFKDNNPTDTVCLFSNQKGDGNEGDNLLDKTLSIYATPDGKIWVAGKGYFYEAASNNYFDNSWHHFALVVRRSGNAISLIDGEPQNEKENTVLGGIAGGKMYLGVRKWDNVNGMGEDRYYTGKLDEFRLWNLAKTTTQIRLDMNSKLHGDEIGLMVYFPFEGYYEDYLGVMHQEPTLENFVTDINATDAIASVGDAYSTDAPNMKDVRPVQSIAYDFVASEDEIIINPKSYLFPELENNIIEITVEGVEDKYGNRMASPVTWTAYVHRNQLRWEDERRSFTKEIYKPMDFVSSIKNTGGKQIDFTIINLPPWLTVSPSSGSINPESTMDILFTISSALNIGEYNEDIILRTEDGFEEKLPITIKVYKTPPDWKVDPTKFEYTMNMVGRIKIEGVLSTDIFDKVAVFVNDSIRGVANLRYLKGFDSYLVFLNIYGNISGQQLDFRIWDASVGQILDDVKPFDVTFAANGVEGTTLDPVIFEAIGLYRQYIPVAQGWNWLSFNKLASNQNDLNSFFSSIEPSQNDQIKTHGGGFNNYDLTNGWLIGSIDSVDNQRMYQMKISKNDTIVYSGESIVPEDYSIELSADWNHIGYLPDLAMDVNDALRLYVADTSEIVKSQYAFSMYDPRVGWLGTLEVMQPGLGYMLNVRNPGILKYPNSTVFKGAKIPHYSSPPLGWESDLSQYQGNMSVVAELDVANVPEVTINDQMVLGAFINGENHGFVSPIVNSRIGYSPFFLNVSNSSNGQITEFRLFDGLTGNTFRIEENRPFVQDFVYGSTQNPLVLTLKTLTTGLGDFSDETFLTCYPNPFGGYINVEFSGRPNKVSIDVVTSTGSLIQRIYDAYPLDGTNRAVWNGKNGKGGEVTSGIYYIRFISGDSVETVKISKTR
jgi:hypothetical protein